MIEYEAKCPKCTSEYQVRFPLPKPVSVIVVECYACRGPLDLKPK